MTELGLYGGTFAPIHLGHVHAARAFYDTLALDRLLVIPAFIPPHKPAAAGDTPADRLRMAELAFADDPRSITISDYEIRSRGKSYTYRTLRHFTAAGTRLTFLCGTDMFLTLDTWRKPEVIFSLARIAHIRRQIDSEETEARIAEKTGQYRRVFHADIIESPSDPVAISSTEVRTVCRTGGSPEGLVPAAVAAYIRENRLYGYPGGEATL